MKKAEVRGCGDILSAKLTFSQKAAQSSINDANLDVQFFKGDLTATDGEGQLKEIIAQLNAQNEWLKQQPIDALVVWLELLARNGCMTHSLLS